MKRITGYDVLLFCFLWYGWMMTFPTVLCLLLNNADDLRAAAEVQETVTEHPLVQLVEHHRNNPAVLLTAFLTAVIIAPLAEEFIFRFLLQGYAVRRFGIAGIAGVSFVFAALHGTERHAYNDTFFLMITGVCIVNITVFLFGLFYFAFIRRFPIQEHLIRFNWTWCGTLQCIGLFAAAVPLIFTLTFFLRSMYPESVSDPVPLFVFSLLLGWVYYRTQQLVPCFLMHAALNALSFALILL